MPGTREGCSVTELWTLFRFRPIDDWFWRGFERSEFYCNAPQNLNDPFDCRVEWKPALQRSLALASLTPGRRRILEAMLKAFDERDPRLNAGVCCFSATLDNALMWSHYSGSHKGVCLMYRIPSTYFNNKYPPTSDGKGFFFVGGSQVFYGDSVFSDWLAAGDLFKPLPDAPIENAVSRIFTSKAKAWEHEEEWRMVTSEPGPLHFEPEFLAQVCFGLGTSAADRACITSIAKRHNPEVVLTEAVRSAKADFVIEYRDV